MEYTISISVKMNTGVLFFTNAPIEFLVLVHIIVLRNGVWVMIISVFLVSLQLKENGIIVSTVISPSEWVGPATGFLTVGDIMLPTDNTWIGLTVVSFSWSFGDVIGCDGSKEKCNC